MRVNYFDVNVGQVMCTDTVTNVTGLRNLVPYFHFLKLEGNKPEVSLVDLANVNILLFNMY